MLNKKQITNCGHVFVGVKDTFGTRRSKKSGIWWTGQLRLAPDKTGFRKKSHDRLWIRGQNAGI